MNSEVKELVSNFKIFNDWEEKYHFIIELGSYLPTLENEKKNDSNKIIGCVSQVWLTFKKEHNRFFFYADSDALIVKGLLAIILKICSGKTRCEIENIDFFNIFNLLGLINHLSASRSNGLFSVVNKIKRILEI